MVRSVEVCASLLSFLFHEGIAEVWIGKENFCYYGDIDDEEKACGVGKATR